MSTNNSSETQTVRQFINERGISKQEERLASLIQLNVGEVMINNAKAVLESRKAKGMNVTDKQNLLDLTFLSFEVKTGRGGIKYLQIQTNEGPVNYHPNAKYGPFISTLSK